MTKRSMDHLYRVWCGIIIALTVACSPPSRTAVSSFELGHDLSADGSIKGRGLNYHFKPYTRGGRVKDLFNFLYFEGDTLCFSITLNRAVKRKQLSVYFIDPVTQRAFPAERIDLHKKTISGFSLIGSVMESFYRKRLKAPIPADQFCCQEIPFIVRLKIDGQKGGLSFQKRGAFIIHYY